MLQVPAVLGAGTEGVTNGGFDSADAWSTSQTATIENGALRLTGSADTSSSQLVKNILGGNTYTFTAKYKRTGNAKEYLTVKFYTPSGTDEFVYVNETSSYHPTSSKNELNKWHEWSRDITVPKHVTAVGLQLRKVGSTTGDVYWDDVSLMGTYGVTPLEENPFKEDASGTAELRLDEMFYYTEKTTATATVSENLAADEVTYTLYEGKTKIWEKTENYGKSFSFALSSPQSSLKEETQYKLSARVKKGSSVIAEGEQIFYRVKRPTALSADGLYYPVTVDKVTGEATRSDTVFNPVITYGIFGGDNDTKAVHTERFKKAAEGGITVVQGYPNSKILDAAQAAGVKVLAVLYSGMIPAGHPEKVARTRYTVNTWKHHEALFGWIVIDEPGENFFKGVKDEDKPEVERRVNSWLLNSYRIIHEEDPHHPVFLMEDRVSAYGKTAKAVDILGIDPYVNTNQDYYSDVFRDADEAVKACKNEKPVYALVQAFDFQTPLPTPEQLRHMVYQAKLAGVKGFGYYKFQGAHKEVINGTTVTQDLPDTVLWPMLKQIKAENDFLFGLGRGELRDSGVYGETEDGKGVLLYMGSEEVSVLTATYATNGATKELIEVEFTPISETEKIAVYEDTANKKRFIWTDGQGLLAPGV